MGAARGLLARVRHRTHRQKPGPNQRPARRPPAKDDFLATLARTGDLDRAAVKVARRLIQQGTMGRARTIAQLLQKNPGTALAGDVCRALVALSDGEPELCWSLVRRNDPQRVLSIAPFEIFRAGFLVAPQEAEGLLTRLRDSELTARYGPREWRAIAGFAFAAGAEAVSAWALQRACAQVPVGSPVAKDAAWLQEWYGRRIQPSSVACDGTSVATFTEEQPQRAATLGRPTEEPDQRAFRSAVTGLPGVRHQLVSRDATSYADVPDGTWLLVTGRLPRPLFGIRPDLPFDERYRPLFVSIEIEDASVLTRAMIEQLACRGPVGCRDWDTYYLLRSAKVPAFLEADQQGAAEAILPRIVAGDDERTVQAAWSQLCAAAVAEGRKRDAAVATPPPSSFDVTEACRTVRAQSVTIERSEPGPSGAEINLELSLDGNLKRHLVIVVDSIVRRASRPLRVHVLCRDHCAADFQRVAERFPSVSFVWLPTDHVDYGELGGMVRHITVATMDRLLLPDLLPEVDRIIHHDLDAVCLADIAELAAVDLNGHPVAAVTSPRGRHRNALNGLRGTAQRLRREGRQDLARELIQRTHLRHDPTTETFNAGVMVLDLVAMRRDDFCREFLPYATHFGLNDQAVMTAYAGGQRLALDESWNWCPRLSDMEHPRIAHWSGPVKPWGDVWVNGQELWAAAERAATQPRTPLATAAAT
ncbi:MAG TPA: glycosyltransferase [Mycobacteriales bacterium]|nr:glycosyltransferase [Mycobacteriales bacterium]